MIIKVQSTSDGNLRNFIPTERIAQTGCSEFADAKSLRKSPLAEALFDLGGIESVLIASDIISVVKKPNANWDDLSPQIMAEILDYAATGAPAVIESHEPDHTDNLDQERQTMLMKKISGLVAARIRPALNRDGGDIELKAFEDGVLWVKLTGKCAGCPYAMRTLKEGVEKILKDYIPEVCEVRPAEKEDIS